MLYLTVGTGIGLGVYINGALHHGILHPEGGRCAARRFIRRRPGIAAAPIIPTAWRGWPWAGHRGTLGKKRPGSGGRAEGLEQEAYYIAQALVDYIWRAFAGKDHSGRRRDEAAAAVSADPPGDSPPDESLSGGRRAAPFGGVYCARIPGGRSGNPGLPASGGAGMGRKRRKGNKVKNHGRTERTDPDGGNGNGSRSGTDGSDGSRRMRRNGNCRKRASLM